MRAGIIACLIALTGGIAGCQETQHCAPGLYGSGCQFSLSGQVDSGRDGGMDTGVDDAGPDGGTDAFVPDAGPCGEMCPTDRPECFIATTGADAGHASGCVECIDRSDCMDLDGGMRTDGGAGGEYICENFECVFGCESDEDCGGDFCRPDHTCSAYPTGVPACGDCDTDANCVAGLACFPYTARGHTGSYCLLVATTGSCPTSSPPFSRPLLGQSADDTTERTFCALHTALQTCEAFRDQQAAKPCATDAECGLDLGGDGRCVMFSGAATTVCSYACTETPPGSGTSTDCVDTDGCSAVAASRFCERP
jgi:hypothetical protein